MTVAELIEKLQAFDVSKEVELEVTDDYRSRYLEMTDDDIRFDDYEDAVIIDGTTLSPWWVYFTEATWANSHLFQSKEVLWEEDLEL